MARYIDADALVLEDFTDAFVDVYDVRIFEHIIENTPTADVAEVKHGEWKKHFSYGCWHYDCSFCDDGFAMREDFKVSQLPNYCSNCGAKMDLSEKPTGCERRDT